MSAHSRNSKFGSLAFIYGACFTPDAAFKKAWLQFEERDTAVENAKAEKIKGEIGLQIAEQSISILEKIKLTTEPESLEGLKLIKEQFEAVSQMIQAKAFAEQSLRSYNKAIEEREFIRQVMNNLLPACRYKDQWLSNPDTAAEMTEMEEWAYIFMSRIENMFMTSGVVGWDHLESMKAHPWWDSTIKPHYLLCLELRQKGQLGEFLASKCLTNRMQELFPEEVRTLPGPSDKVQSLLGTQADLAKLGLESIKPATEDLLPQLARLDKHEEYSLNMTQAQISEAKKESLHAAVASLKNADLTYLLGAPENE